jgi:hypothetical protein
LGGCHFPWWGNHGIVAWVKKYCGHPKIYTVDVGPMTPIMFVSEMVVISAFCCHESDSTMSDVSSHFLQ